MSGRLAERPGKVNVTDVGEVAALGDQSYS